MSVYVFLGPSLPLADARPLLDATFLPPVALGDLTTLMPRKPAVIAIVDGLFDSTPSVWHKEILYALSQGVHVCGAASMGALRAAETHAFGMVGVGEVFRAYRDGTIEDDDEVAVVHGDARTSYRPLSDALVNIRAGLRRAEGAGLISEATHRRLLAAAKEEFYPRRFWPDLIRGGAALGLPEAELASLGKFVREERPDQKREDAVELLRYVAALRSSGPPPHVPTFSFEPTTYWRRFLEEEVRAGRDAGDGSVLGGVRREAFLRHIRGVAGDREELLRSALLLSLVEAEARRSPTPVSPERRGRVLRRLRSNPSFADLPDDQFQTLADLEAHVEELGIKLRRTVDRFLPSETRRRGVHAELLSGVAAKWAYLESAGTPNPSVVDAGVAEEAMLEWYRARFGIDEIDAESHARDLGFDTLDDFSRELAAEYLAEKAGVGQPALATRRVSQGPPAASATSTSPVG